MNYSITQTNGNSRNNVKGSRLSVWNKSRQLIDRFTVPSQNGRGYCRRHPNGEYAKRLAQAIAEAEASN